MEYRHFLGPREAQLCILLDGNPGSALTDYVEEAPKKASKDENLCIAIAFTLSLVYTAATNQVSRSARTQD